MMSLCFRAGFCNRLLSVNEPYTPTKSPDGSVGGIDPPSLDSGRRTSCHAKLGALSLLTVSKTLRWLKDAKLKLIIGSRLSLEKEVCMTQTKQVTQRPHRWVLIGLLISGLLVLAALPAVSAKRAKDETIEATAMGTGSQMGQMIGVSVEIYEYSTPEDRKMLLDAFAKGQNQGLVNALTKMRAVGHISITGTLGFDLAFIKMIPTPTGRKIRFVTNRQLRYGEVWADAQSTSFNLTAGEFELDDTDKSKNTGVLYPECQLAIDKQGQLQIELNQNAWKLVDVIDWKGTPGVN